MKMGETVNGFKIVSEPTTSGGGRCVWAFAERQGKRYFIKQFLDPKWPTEASMGSEASKERRRDECREFERRHNEINNKINPRAIGGGNLVAAIDFFREGTAYYKVTDRVDAVARTDLSELTTRQRVVVLRTLCNSMKLLHRAGIVHGDLKPANVLLQKSGTGELFTAKVIDFDDSYPSGEPPPPDQIVGDQQYGAPEWLRYVKQDPAADAKQLTTAADIFALGLVFHTYLTGDLPGFDRSRFGAPAESVWGRQPLQLHPELDPRTRDLLARMTSLAIEKRPTVDKLLELLADDSVVVLAPAHAAAPTRPAAEPAVVPGPRRSRVRTNFTPEPSPTPEPEPVAPPPVPEPAPPTTSRVRKNF